MRKPKIIKRGDNPNCIHYEIIVGDIGTCRYCGQVRDYSVCDFDDTRPDYAKEKSSKGGKAYAALYGD